ncbi:hypothetical protein [Haloplanus sp. C73]|uniref:hypothetical protein n=1 Tax=Haloplanus sp. C73 TaxID=3421641 RepID=UPI003EC137EE
MADESDADADSAPLDDLASEVRARREQREAAEGVDADAPPDDDLFEPVDVDQIDEDAVWEAFAEGEMAPEAEVGLGSTVEAAAPDEHVVSKREFCQRCPHFSAPPDVACTHEGTTIVEVVDIDDFRVRNCPIVEDEDAATPD